MSTLFKSRHKIIIFLISFLFLLQSFPTLVTLSAQAADPFSLTSEKQGLFQGLPEKFKGFFDSSSQKFNGFFRTLQQWMGGASEGTPVPISPTPTPQIPVMGDLLQIESSWTASCQSDLPPDELHEATTSRDESCDWEIPEPILNEYTSDPAACEGHWKSHPISCQKYYNSYNESGEGGCMGNSSIETCLIRVAENTYHMHWKLHFEGNEIKFNQQGEKAGDHLLGPGKITETLLFGVYQDATGTYQDDYYYWPSPNRAMMGSACGQFGWCAWGTDGTITCNEDNQNFSNLAPYEFTTDALADSGNKVAIGFQMKPREGCCGNEGGCKWVDDSPFEGQLSEYTAISEWSYNEALNQINCALPNSCMATGDCNNTSLGALNCDQSQGAAVCCTPDPPPPSDVVCDPITFGEGANQCVGCAKEGYPSSVSNWTKGRCEYPPDPDDACYSPPTPEQTFKECPLGSGCNQNPLDLCWGLYDTASQYDPYIDPNGINGPTTDCSGRNALYRKECRYQVPATNIVKYLGGTCNEAEHLVKDFRQCSPIYYNPVDPSAVLTSYYAYIRKLNGCNAYFEGSIIPETGPEPGLPADSPPPQHTGYCQTEGSTINVSGENIDSQNLCQTSDGMRCVNTDSESNVCRKAIRVETFEKAYRTTTAPPANAFTANCLVKAANGNKITCGHNPTCVGADYCPTDEGAFDCNGQWCCGTCTSNTSPPNVSSPTSSDCTDPCTPSTCPRCSGEKCCTDCEQDQGCEEVEAMTTCSYPTLGACDTTDTDASFCGTGGGCANIDNCCKEKSYCRSPLPADGDANSIDSGTNPARNCEVYEWTTRENIYTVEYESNAMDLNLHIQNLSDHAIKDPETEVELTVELPDFIDFVSQSSPFITTYPSETMTFSGDKIDSVSGGNICLSVPEANRTTCNGHGGNLKWTFSSIPAGADFNITLHLVPADKDNEGNSYYADHEIGSDKLDHYTNELYSDDRLANLEFKAEWANSRVIELESFWIGQGVLANITPCSKDNPCFTDPDGQPFGWPVAGEINQDWGGMDDGNPLASAWGPRYGDGEGLYVSGCGDSDEGNEGWRHAGIEIIPNQDLASPTEVFSTHAGYVTFAGENVSYPDRGTYVEVQASSDDDCQANFVTRYDNLLTGSLRVSQGEYVPRHKMLGIMGYSGQGPGGTDYTGYTHLTYQVRYGATWNSKYLDIADNNMPACIDGSTTEGGEYPTGIDPLTLDDYSFQEPDDVNNPSEDSCSDNPYVCKSEEPIQIAATYPDFAEVLKQFETCDPTDNQKQYYFFCEIRNAGDNIRRCFYANP